MPIIDLLIVILVVGLLLWLVQTVVPLDPKVRTVFNAVVVLLLVLWILRAFGLGDVVVPRIR